MKGTRIRKLWLQGCSPQIRCLAVTRNLSQQPTDLSKHFFSEILCLMPRKSSNKWWPTPFTGGLHPDMTFKSVEGPWEAIRNCIDPAPQQIYAFRNSKWICQMKSYEAWEGFHHCCFVQNPMQGIYEQFFYANQQKLNLWKKVQCWGDKNAARNSLLHTNHIQVKMWQITVILNEDKRLLNFNRFLYWN